MSDIVKEKSTAPEYDPQYILQVKDLKKHFPIKGGMISHTVGHVKAVDGVTFNLKRGTTMGLVGESGCGKTTTGRSIIKLYNITGGNVYFKGIRIAAGKKAYMDAINQAKEEYKAQVAEHPEKAAELIAEAQNRFAEETPDFQLALEGDANGAGFLEVIEQYGSTPSGNLAKHCAGICYYKLGI